MMLFYGTWLDLLVIVFLGIILIFTLRKYTLPNIKKRKIILSIFFSLISFSLLLLLILTSIEYINDRKDYYEWLEMYKFQAKEDISKDMINLEYFGFPSFTTIKDCETVDSITKKYGVRLVSVSDLDNGPLLEKAKDKYDEITNSYLDKRNGFGWRKRMDKELEPYVDRRKCP